MILRSNRGKEDRPMRPILAYLGLFLACLVVLFSLINIAEPYLFVLLGVAVVLVAASVVTGR